jgi:hypothetical protein
MLRRPHFAKEKKEEKKHPSERLMRVGLNGTMIGPPGYARGAASRLDTRFNDEQMQNRILSNEHSYDDYMSKLTQRTANYSSQLPQLSTFPGNIIAVQYQEMDMSPFLYSPARLRTTTTRSGFG